MPEIAFDNTKLVFKQEEFKAYMQEELSAGDFATFQNLYLKYDNENLLRLIFDEGNDAFNEMGVFTKDELLEALNEEEPKNKLKPYLNQFITEYRETEDKGSAVVWEHRLITLYYRYAIKSNNPFLRNWFNFEFMIFTVMAAINSRKHGLSTENQIVDIDDELIQSIAKSSAKDFGLSLDYPIVQSILNIYDIDNILKREEALDRLRWDWIDEQTTFEYFSLDVIMAMLLKLRIIDRWITADPAIGKQLFKNLLDEIKLNSKKEI